MLGTIALSGMIMRSFWLIRLNKIGKLDIQHDYWCNSTPFPSNYSDSFGLAMIPLSRSIFFGPMAVGADWL